MKFEKYRLMTHPKSAQHGMTIEQLKGALDEIDEQIWQAKASADETMEKYFQMHWHFLMNDLYELERWQKMIDALSSRRLSHG